MASEDPILFVSELLAQCRDLVNRFDQGLARTIEARGLDDDLRRFKALLPQDGSPHRIRLRSIPGDGARLAEDVGELVFIGRSRACSAMV